MSVCLKDTGSFCAYWRKEPRNRKASAIMANTIELKQQIQQGAYDAAFVKLYGADVDVNAQRERYISVIDQFENEFGSGRSVRLYSAPAAPIFPMWRSGWPWPRRRAGAKENPWRCCHEIPC